jgi:hypothetical protein
LNASNAAAKVISFSFISNLISVIPAAGQTRRGNRSFLNGAKNLQHLSPGVHTHFCRMANANILDS